MKRQQELLLCSWVGRTCGGEGREGRGGGTVRLRPMEEEEWAFVLYEEDPAIDVIFQMIYFKGYLADARVGEQPKRSA